MERRRAEMERFERAEVQRIEAGRRFEAEEAAETSSRRRDAGDDMDMGRRSRAAR